MIICTAGAKFSTPVPVGSVDLLGLNRVSTTRPSETAPPPSPARLQLRSPYLANILKPGCSAREVEWKDLAIQKQIGIGSRYVTSVKRQQSVYGSSCLGSLIAAKFTREAGEVQKLL
ncbi:unnamed protein product [Phytophthora lilii]|uniref:Unnamed protein product n=1 Tax=Phytophthora lilii TaxID=2077276 RepID=A0A9W6WKG6_9STRA|nr:unnamed protein product [Phytophthora lilii]